jgi:hypothetical protein
MNNFDKRYNQLLNEVNFGGIARGVGNFAKEVVKQAPGAVASAVNAAQNPGEGIKNVIGGIKGKFEERKKLKEEPFSLKNPPKVGSIVITQDAIYGIIEQEREDKNGNITTELKITTKIPKATIFGKITSKINPKDGTYGVALTDDKGNPSNKYVYAQTPDAPYWRIFDRKDALNMGHDKFFINKETGERMVLTSLIVGITKEDVDDNLRRWKDYNQYLNQAKQGKLG